MCGIVGYVGNKNSVKYLINGLKALEYRGYDSAGVAIVASDCVKSLRAVGKVAALEEKLSACEYNFSANLGIAHTRWATHGKPSEHNAHPHRDCSGEIAVVHNGIIENYSQFKDELEARGHKFLSDTDTEVVAHLLEEKLANVKSNYDKALLHAVQEIFPTLDGSFALAIVWAKAPNTIVGLRRKAPLVIGVSDGETFLASDVSAFIETTDRAIYLDDSDVAFLSGDKIEIYDKFGKLKKNNIAKLEKSMGNIGKNGYEHYMRKEIYEQPEAIRKTVESSTIDLEAAFGVKKSELRDIHNIMLVGCGTAYHATMVAKYWFEEFSNIPTQSELASEYKYRAAAMPKETLSVFVSQSGETADTVAALEKAKSAGFKSVAVCNVHGSTITRESDWTFYTKCGPEISVASTKAFTSQLAALFPLSLLVASARGNIDEARLQELLHELTKVPDYMEHALSQEDEIKRIAAKYYKSTQFVFLGRNVNYPLALEGALKLKEITYLHAEGFAAGEIKHGPIALIDKDTPVLAIMGDDYLFDKMTNACEEVIARGAKVIAVTDETGSKKLERLVEDRIVLKNIDRSLFPLVNAVALQLFAYHVAKLNGREIDQPRNLAKSVTVE